MKETTPYLSVKLTVTCPECEHWFDMVNDTDLNEEGWLLDQVLPDGHWSEEHKKFECTVTCPECKKRFKANFEHC